LAGGTKYKWQRPARKFDRGPKSLALLNFFNIHRGDPYNSNFRRCIIQFWRFLSFWYLFAELCPGPGCVLHMDVGFLPSQKNYRLLWGNPILEPKKSCKVRGCLTTCELVTEVYCTKYMWQRSLQESLTGAQSISDRGPCRKA
jgi:hypothetical protein